jgi:hypothetical protein
MDYRSYIQRNLDTLYTERLTPLDLTREIETPSLMTKLKGIVLPFTRTEEASDYRARRRSYR